MISVNGIYLYGDGMHDDTSAIQQLLDSGLSEIYLPGCENFYLISSTLIIHSHQTLSMARSTEIRLAAGSDCLMLSNATADDSDICINGGIWNFNNKNQSPNPIETGKYTCGETCDDGAFMTDYMGVMMRFCGIERFTLANVTLKDPVTFCVELAHIKHFTVENIFFDFNYGNPTPVNMDGIHLDGYCHFGTIRNLKGACYDDLVAINADDFLRGPISDIAVDGIFANDCHSAVRLLSTRSNVERITINNVFGTYYQYTIGFTYFYPYDGINGNFDAITLSNIYASKAERRPIYCKGDSYVYSLIFIDENLHIKNLNISGLHRVEAVTAIPLITVKANTRIDSSRFLKKTSWTNRFPWFTTKGKSASCTLIIFKPAATSL